MSVLVRSPGRCMAPADALVLLEQLQESVGAGDDTNTDLAYALNTVRYAVARNIPVAARFEQGRNGPSYDAYYCPRCGASVGLIGVNYCNQCGQRLSDAYCGRRKTAQEQREHVSAATLRAMDDVEGSITEARDGAKPVKLEDFLGEGGA